MGEENTNALPNTFQPEPGAETSDEAAYVVLDLEMCKVQRMKEGEQYRRKMEIIQIGAALLNKDFELAGEFSRYVKPKYGYIDGFIRNLTGINGSDVANAKELETVLCEFTDWMPKNAVIVSWSMSDRSQLYGEMRAKGIHSEVLEGKYEGWIDCQRMFGEKMDMQRSYSLEEALVAADIFTEGRAHDGLVDACNTALLYAKMNTEQEFQMNPYYKQAHDANHDSHLSCSIGELLSGMNLNSVLCPNA